MGIEYRPAYKDAPTQTAFRALRCVVVSWLEFKVSFVGPIWASGTATVSLIPISTGCDSIDIEVEGGSMLRLTAHGVAHQRDVDLGCDDGARSYHRATPMSA